MNGARHQFLARSRLAVNQDRGVGIGNFGNQCKNILHDPGMSDNVNRGCLRSTEYLAQSPIVFFDGTYMNCFGNELCDRRKDGQLSIQILHFTSNFVS